MTTITLAQIASSHQAAALRALPSPLSENFTFDELRVGDHQSLTHTLTARVSVAVKDPSNQHITLACRCTNQHGDDVITGSAQVLAPQEKCWRRASDVAVAVAAFAQG
jgi:acyl dehydratase